MTSKKLGLQASAYGEGQEQQQEQEEQQEKEQEQQQQKEQEQEVEEPEEYRREKYERSEEGFKEWELSALGTPPSDKVLPPPLLARYLRPSTLLPRS